MISMKHLTYNDKSFFTFRQYPCQNVSTAILIMCMIKNTPNLRLKTISKIHVETL